MGVPIMAKAEKTVAELLAEIDADSAKKKEAISSKIKDAMDELRDKIKGLELEWDTLADQYAEATGKPKKKSGGAKGTRTRLGKDELALLVEGLPKQMKGTEWSKKSIIDEIGVPKSSFMTVIKKAVADGLIGHKGEKSQRVYFVKK
jgi:hypothetical protein